MEREVYSYELSVFKMLRLGLCYMLKNIEKIAVIAVFILFPIRIFATMLMQSSFKQFRFALDFYPIEWVLQEGIYFAVKKIVLEGAVFICLLPIAVISIALIIQGYMEEEEVGILESLGQALRRWPKLIYTGIFFAGLLFLSLCVPIIGILIAGYFFVMWIFYMHVVGLCGEKGLSALRHSRNLTAFHMGRIFRMILVLCAIGFLMMTWLFSLHILFGTVFLQIAFVVCVLMLDAFVVCVFTVFFLEIEGQGNEAYVMDENGNVMIKSEETFEREGGKNSE